MYARLVYGRIDGQGYACLQKIRLNKEINMFNNKTMNEYQLQQVALMLRIGLGLVFVIGGWSKLSLLLNESTHQGMVDNYMGTAGYINTLFQEFLFTGAIGNVLTPAGFLTTLSAFELISGLMLVIGFLVRPLAIFYAFLLWTFVFSLPVVTTPGVEAGVKTYTSPAIFVQIRDIALSGFMFVLYNIGAGNYSIDQRIHAEEAKYDWNSQGLIIRLSLAAPFLVAGFFGGFANIQSFATPLWVLMIVGLVLVFSSVNIQRAAGAVVMAVIIWFIAHKLSADKSLIGNLNGFKRELAIFAGGLVMFIYAGGARFTISEMLTRSRFYLANFTKQTQS